MRTLSLMVIILCLMAGYAHSSGVSDEARKIDDFPDICCEDEMARLDNFAIELQNEPEARGYIIIYGGRYYVSCYNQTRPRRPRRGEALMRAARMPEYLNVRGINPQRVTMIDGGYRESWMAELWIVSKGAHPPKPTPTLQLKDIKFRKGKVSSRHFECSEI